MPTPWQSQAPPELPVTWSAGRHYSVFPVFRNRNEIQQISSICVAATIFDRRRARSVRRGEAWPGQPEPRRLRGSVMPCSDGLTGSQRRPLHWREGSDASRGQREQPMALPRRMQSQESAQPQLPASASQLHPCRRQMESYVEEGKARRK